MPPVAQRAAARIHRIVSVAGGSVLIMTTGIQEVVYRRPSALADDGLELETAGRHASYFTGFLTAARPAAMCLAVLADVAAADFRQDEIGTPGLRDPVVTCGGDRMRFEALSGCCGVGA